jgi:hypothetical protein
MAGIASHDTTRLLLSTGDSVVVAGSLEDVGKALQDAARSSHGTLAWLVQADGEETIGVNPLQVVTVSQAD